MDDADGAEWEEGEDVHHFIQEEPPRVLALSASTRFRTFAPLKENEPVRIGKSERDFFVCKRRRYEEKEKVDPFTDPYAVPLSHILRDSFDIAARQMETYNWLTGLPPPPSDIKARLALDRRLGAVPCLAAVNKAVSLFSSAEDSGSVLDLAEDVIMDNSTVAMSTVVTVVQSLRTDPIRAARLALTLQGQLPASASIPLTVWMELCSALSRYSHRLPKPLGGNFMELLEGTLQAVRQRSETLSEALIVEFGSCLLSSKRPLSAAVRLVQEELLSGRNRRRDDDALESMMAAGEDSEDKTMSLPLSAFLTDLLVTVCHSAKAREESTDCSEEKKSDTRLPTEGRKQAEELLTFCGDVVKYTFARKISLAPKAFDAVLDLCDSLRDYNRLCVLFVAMCVLSAPTLRSTLRVVEVLNTVVPLQTRLTDLLHRTPQSVIVWCMKRFSSIASPCLSTANDSNTSKEECGLVSLCDGIGVLLASNRSAPAEQPASTPAVLPSMPVTQAHEVVDTLLRESAFMRGAAALVSAFVFRTRMQLRHSTERNHALGDADASGRKATHEQLRVMEAANASVLEALLQDSTPAAPVEGSAMKRNSSFAECVCRDGCYIDVSVKSVFASPQTYCNVLDVSAVNTLAEQPSGEAAFVRMMNSYVSKSGAVVVLSVELLSAPYGMTEEGFALVRAWRQAHASWFNILPFSLSLQLSGATDFELAADFFLTVRKAGHQKVALVTANSASIELAKSLNVQPAIFLPDLLTRLTNRPA